MLEVRNLVKTYKVSKSNDVVRALDNVSITFPETGLVFLLGKSGSGKSTLLNSIGGLDSFDSGEIIIKGKSSKNFSQADFDSYRNTFIGFIFQEYNVLEEFTVAKNLSLALELQGKRANKEDVDALLKQVDMLSFANRKPNQLSGGQKQRVAIARALIKNPEIIMADEPTGALDSNTGKQVMDTLKNLSKQKLIIIVSHDREFAEIYGDRIVELKDGKIISDVTKKEVEANRTESGISFIQNKVIHIRKGQQITNEDLKNICYSIVQNSKTCDTIISLDESSNESVKKANSITDSGNQEIFLNTTPQDIRSRNYNGNDFKLIKSRLKWSDSFKMGASALKNKVGKLIFTIFLSFIAFAMFGLVDTLSSFNRPDAVYNTITETGQDKISILKESKGEYSNEALNLKDSDYDYFVDKYKNIDFLQVVGTGFQLANGYVSSGNSIYVGGLNSYGSNELKQSSISGMVGITNTKLNDLGFSLAYGRLPQADNEICISKYLYECIKYNNSDKITSYADLVDTYGSNFVIENKDYKLVGIVDDKIDTSKFELTEEEIRSNYMQVYQLANELNFGFVKMVYTTESQFNTVKVQNSSAYLKVKTDNDYIESSNVSNFYKLSNYTSNITYYKNGDVNNIVLGANEVIVSQYCFSYTENLQSAIDSGLTIKIGASENNLQEYTVVGYMYDNYNIVMSDSTYNSVVVPATNVSDYMIALLGENAGENKSFIYECESFNSDGFKFTVQNGSTEILDSFGSTIESIAQVFLYVGIGFAVFASFLLMSFISTSISYKRREIGILRALGARGSDVFGIFFNESCIIALINFVLATIATFVAAFFINGAIISGLGIELVLLGVGLRQILLILGVSLLAAFVASIIPVSKISRKKPIDAIHNR
ncbi:MAG: ATP-binding cassette domain-containing protein [Clostridia bacterium]|nr:ATP-binding cassette domain-containing protein [Clostridia bacterium]